MHNDTWRAYPALPYFLCLAIGIVWAAAGRPSPVTLTIACGIIGGIHFVARRWLWPRAIAVSWLIAVVGGCWLATEQLAMHDEWLHRIREGENAWNGYVTPVYAPGEDITWHLHLLDWDGSGRPIIHVVLSQFHPRAEEWDDLKVGTFVTVTGALRHPRRGGNPGEMDWRSYSLRRGVVGTLYAEHVTVNEKPETAWYTRFYIAWHTALHSVQHRLTRLIYEYASEEAAPVLIGMLLGVRTALPEHVETAFRRTGLSHILAVSGLHVGIVAGLAWSVGRIWRRPRWQQASITVLAVWFFVALTGGRPSALRAGIASTLAAFHVVLRRPAEPINVWAIAGCTILLLQPLTLFDAGFQLSFAASGSILLWLDVVRQRLAWQNIHNSQLTQRQLGKHRMLHQLRHMFIHFKPKVMQYVLATGIVSASAQLGTSGLVAYYFHELSLIGVLANVCIVPMVGPVVMMTLWGVLLAVVWPAAGQWLIGTAGRWIAGIVSLLEHVAQWPGAAVEVSAPSFLTALAMVAGFFGLPLLFHMTSPKRRRMGLRFTLFAMLLWNGAVWWPIYEAHLGVVEVIFLDVGQGDAIVVRTPRKGTVIIDGGGNPRWHEESFTNIGDTRIMPYLQHQGIRRVAAVMNTHPDEDHLQGLVPVLRERPVALIIDSEQIHETKTFAEYETLRMEKSIPYFPLKRGSYVVIDDVEFHILHPQHAAAQHAGSLNDHSVVIRMVTKHGTLLFTGDASRQTQQELLWQAKNVHVQADVIKVPHHGSRHDVDLRFIHAVAPDIAVIQVGRNSYGHPAPETLTAYQQFGSQVWRTDQHGAITVSFRPSGIQVKSYREGEAL